LIQNFIIDSIFIKIIRSLTYRMLKKKYFKGLTLLKNKFQLVIA